MRNGESEEQTPSNSSLANNKERRGNGMRSSSNKTGCYGKRNEIQGLHRTREDVLDLGFCTDDSNEES